MKNSKKAILLLSLFVGSSQLFAKVNNNWNDLNQDSIQIKSPVEFIDTYNKYTVVGENKKIKLVDFGNIEKVKKDVKFTLKNYGVQVLNGRKVYNVFKVTTALNSSVDFNLLYRDKNVVAFRIRDNSKIDYVKNPFKSFTVNTYVYNFSSNRFSSIPVLNSESDLKESNIDSLRGDQFVYNAKKGIYTYLANIKFADSGKLGVLKVDLDKNLKCISSSQGCDNVGISIAELVR